jgi:hypothetical protein
MNMIIHHFIMMIHLSANDALRRRDQMNMIISWFVMMKSHLPAHNVSHDHMIQ